MSFITPIITSYEMEPLKEYWEDAVLVAIVPEKDIFYAQRISDLEGPFGYCLCLEDFEKSKNIFTKTTDEHISHYQEIAFPLLELLMTKTQRENFSRFQISESNDKK